MEQIIPDFIQDAANRFAEDPFTVQIDGADVFLPDDARELRSRAREFVADRVAPLAARIDRDNETPDELRRDMAEAGFFGLSIPEEYGGQGSVLQTCLAVEEFSRLSASIGLIVAVGLLGSTPLVLAGAEKQKQDWLPGFAAGERFSSFCLTEPGAGTDAASVSTSVSSNGDGYTLNGLKHYITGAGWSDLYTVFARSGDGDYEMTAMLLPAGTPGFDVQGRHPFTGIRGIPVGQLTFDRVALPDDAVLGEPGRGFQVALATLDRARPAIAAQAIGVAQGAYDAAISYLGNRVQFGKPLLQKDVIQHRLARHAASLAAGRMLTYHAARMADEDRPELNSAASMAKLYCTDLAMQVVTDAVQFCGGAGYMVGSPVERMYRDVKIMQIYEGTNEIQEMVISRALMREYENVTS